MNICRVGHSHFVIFLCYPQRILAKKFGKTQKEVVVPLFGGAAVSSRLSICYNGVSQCFIHYTNQLPVAVGVSWMWQYESHTLFSFCLPANSTCFFPLYRDASIPSYRKTLPISPTSPKSLDVMPEFSDYFNL